MALRDFSEIPTRTKPLTRRTLRVSLLKQLSFSTRRQ
jgi:hypothetical protein